MTNENDGFEWKNTWITDPTVSACGRFAVDPVEYYGKPYTDWVKLNEYKLMHKIAELESQGITTSDAQGIVGAEIIRAKHESKTDMHYKILMQIVGLVTVIGDLDDEYSVINEIGNAKRTLKTAISHADLLAYIKKHDSHLAQIYELYLENY